MEHLGTMWAPPVINWFTNPMDTVVIRIKTIVIEVMCTNLAIIWGPHIVPFYPFYYSWVALSLLHFLTITLC